MKKYYQTNPLNLTTVSAIRGLGDLKSQQINNEIEKYFRLVTINKKVAGPYKWVTASVPFISLFTNESYRNQFLEYNASKNDADSKKLRHILTDPDLRTRNYALIVEKIGDIIKSCEQESFEITTCAYTLENYMQGGKRIRYYLNVSGKPCNKPDTKDLTGVYKAVKEYRKRNNGCVENSGKQIKA